MTVVKTTTNSFFFLIYSTTTDIFGVNVGFIVGLSNNKFCASEYIKPCAVLGFLLSNFFSRPDLKVSFLSASLAKSVYIIPH